MHRKDFIKSCGFACLGSAAMGRILQSCTSSKIIGGKISGDELIIPLSDFETSAGNEKHFKKYIVVQNEILQYPICVYRHKKKSMLLCGCVVPIRVQNYRCLATNCNALHMAVSLAVKALYKQGPLIVSLEHLL